MLEYCADQGIAAVCHGSLLGGFLRYASMSRSLLPYNRSLLPYNRSLCPFVTVLSSAAFSGMLV
jgi:hypothetical protein